MTAPDAKLCSLVLFVLVLAVGGGSSAFAADSPIAMLQQAVDEYTAGLEATAKSQRLVKFSRAQQLFQQAIDARHASGLPISGDLWVSLGNAALQAENVGVAIVAYRRALVGDPSHMQALQNLDYARSTLPDWIRFSDPKRLTDTLFFWQAIYSHSQIALAASLSFLLAAALFAASLIRAAKLYRTAALFAAAIWLVLSLSLFADRSAASGRSAVVIADECILRAADSTSAAARLNQPLPDGAELQLLSTRDRWSEVEVNGRSGWVLSSALELVSS